MTIGMMKGGHWPTKLLQDLVKGGAFELASHAPGLATMT